jgi:hypothetical protein
MTEDEWLACIVPEKMLDYLQGEVSNRKLRLLAVACCQRLKHLFNDECSRAIEVAERFADGEAGQAELDTASHSHRQAEALYTASHSHLPDFVWLNNLPTYLAVQALIRDPITFSIHGVLNIVVDALGITERTYQCLLLRDLFGNPFRSIILNPVWLTWHDGLLVSMARQMYGSRDFSDLSVMADALEEAGCSDQDILGHCRSGGEHVRGCWVVDTILGKT